MSKSFPIVGIGASAGGIEALEKLFHATPEQAMDMAFVVVMHLDPKSHSLLPSLLARWTSMAVKAIEEGEKVEPQHIYVIPPDAVATIKSGRLHLRKPAGALRERTPIDVFFTSLAEDQGEAAIGIVLSGAGTDGALGIKAIKEHGGFTLAQGGNDSQPSFKDMPQSAIATGLVDLVLPVEHIAEWLSRLTHVPPPTVEEKNADELRPIHAILRDRVGHDFSQYKTRTFLRRVARRMQVLQLNKLSDYIEALNKDPEEATLLFRDLLIGVTEFFRNPEAFAALESLVIPRIFENKGADDEIRVWVAGCATGEEAYSIAILLREYANQHFKTTAPPKVVVFASDIDSVAMKTARMGRYPASALKALSAERLNRFFTPEDGEYRVVRDLRDLCVFTDHDLIRDPPFSRLDLLSCRNLLIYLKTDLQKQIFPIFHYALRPRGFLFLGVSESIMRHNELFVPVDRVHRIFQRRDLISPVSVAVPQFSRAGTGGFARGHAQVEKPPAAGALRIAATLIADRYSPAYVVVNDRWEVLHSSARTGKYLEPPVGAPNRDLFAWARREIRFDLRDALHKAMETNRTVTREHIPIEVNGGVQNIKITVEPIRDGGENVYAIVFADMGAVRPREAGEEPKGRSKEDVGENVDHLETELQETRERLQATIEELETANEELKSSNEELLSVNEELQSTNEEMETSKEEIQSVNEELQTVNHALNQKIEELDRANTDLQNLFESTQVAVIFLDDKLVVRSFTPSVKEIFNLIPTDRGRSLMDIVNRLDDDSLERQIVECMQNKQVVERRVSARGGQKRYLARVVPYRTGGFANDGVVVVFVDITDIVAAEEHQKAVARELDQLFRSTMDAVSSIANQTAVHAASVPAFIDVFVTRLAALSFTHALLSQREWSTAPLDRLILAELGEQAQTDGKVKVEGPLVPLTPHAALTLGIVFHELAADAARYGALSVSGGTAEVRWTLNGPNTNRQLEIVWSETGGPQRGSDPSRSFGFELIQRTLSVELKGNAEIGFREGGLRCAIIIPTNQATAAAPAAQ